MARKYSKRTTPTKLSLTSECTALYIRVSTDRQADEGYSLDAQRGKLDAYCTAMGWPVCADHVYIDGGESGKSTARPAYRAMLAAIDAGEVNRIVATKLDRLTRNVTDFRQMLDYCDARNVAIVSLAENFDTSTPMGKAMATIVVTFAEMERSMITDRVMTGKAEKARQGGYNGSVTPYGYQYSDGTFTIDSSAADVVQRIFAEWIDGTPMAHIAAALNADKIPSPRGRTWSTAGVRHMLRNGAYAGLTQWDGVETAGDVYPPIITVADYECAAAALAAVKPGKRAAAG